MAQDKTSHTEPSKPSIKETSNETKENQTSDAQAIEEENQNKNEEGIQTCEKDDSKSCSGTRIEIIKDGDDFHWMLYASNGKMIATNPVPFSRLNDLKETLKSVEENLKKTPIVRLY